MHGITEIIVVHDVYSEIVVPESYLCDPNIAIECQSEYVTKQETDILSASCIGSKSLSEDKVVVLVVDWQFIICSNIEIDSNIHSPVAIVRVEGIIHIGVKG